MSSKKKAAPHEVDCPRPLKVGGRVRCTDDDVEGRQARFVKVGRGKFALRSAGIPV